MCIKVDCTSKILQLKSWYWYWKSCDCLLSTPKIFKSVSGFRYLLKILLWGELSWLKFKPIIRMCVLVCACIYTYLHVRVFTFYVMSWNGFHLCELPIFQHSLFCLESCAAKTKSKAGKTKRTRKAATSPQNKILIIRSPPCITTSTM